MAKIRLGVMVGEASGSLGSTVFSHNRSGSYVRLRAVPTRSTSLAAETAKARLSAASKIWGTLTEAQRLAWETWAQTNPITDRLGDKRILSGHGCVTQLNINILTAGGTTIDVPPATGAPEGVSSITAAYDIGAGSFSLAYTPTPIGADNVVYVWCAVTNSPGVSYVSNLYKLVHVSDPNAASPVATIQADIEARFGALAVGQQVFYRVQVVDSATGLVSASFPTNGVVIST